MKIKEILSQIFRKISTPFKGKGLRKLPLVIRIYNFLYQCFKPSDIVLIDVQGSKMYVDSRDTGVASSLLKWGSHEGYETELFKKLIKKGTVVVDVGAHIGYYTLLAARLSGEKGKVFAFEPDPYNCVLLEKNVQVNGYNNVIIEQKAILDRCGAVKLFLSLHNLGTHRIYDFHDGRKWITVEGITLDEYFGNRDDKVDVVKIDIEGAEMAALLGMDRVIKANENLKMFIEFSPRRITQAGFSPREFLNKLLEYGFKLYIIDEQKKVTKQTCLDEVMELCSRTRFNQVNLFLERARIERFALENQATG